MKTQTLTSQGENIITLSPRLTRAEGGAQRAEIHIDALGRVQNFSPRAARTLATSLEVSRRTGWRDNKLCRHPRDIFSCLHLIGRYPATSNKRNNGLIHNHNDGDDAGQWWP